LNDSADRSSLRRRLLQREPREKANTTRIAAGIQVRRNTVVNQ